MTDLGRTVVLLVEDDVAFRRSVAAYLEDSGFSVLEADDGVAALELLSQHLPNIIISDLRMPRMSGLELLDALKRQRIETPVIMISGTADKVLLAETESLGASAYLTKPIADLARLEELTRSLLFGVPG
ncbi:MAG TPA: response regulator [Polyangiaceae bacterium]|nr:response regulator [Polyangiaceae bacterium]